MDRSILESSCGLKIRDYATMQVRLCDPAAFIMMMVAVVIVVLMVMIGNNNKQSPKKLGCEYFSCLTVCVVDKTEFEISKAAPIFRKHVQVMV